MNTRIFASAAAALAASALANAAVVPFTETFSAGPANWSGPSGPADWSASGGPGDSPYISAQTNVNSESFGTVIALRSQAMAGASAGAFVGNWIADGVTTFTFDVRHDAPAPLTVGVRFASSFNFPAAVAVQFAPVLPGVWTTVTIPIDPFYPGFVSFEGTDFNTVFSSIGNIQLLYSVPAGFEGTGTLIRIDADNVTIVPAPGAALAAGILALGALRRRR